MCPFQKLDVYQAAVSFLALVQGWAGNSPEGSTAMQDHLKRAALSIPLNLVDQDGARRGKEAARRRAAELTRRLWSFARGGDRTKARADTPALIQETMVLLKRIVPRNIVLKTDLGARRSLSRATVREFRYGFRYLHSAMVDIKADGAPHPFSL